MVGLKGLKCRFERRGCWALCGSSRGFGQVTPRREDGRYVTKYGTDVEERAVEQSQIDGRGSWKAKEGLSVLEVVYGGDRLYALSISF
jgi:hypothetical protein